MPIVDPTELQKADQEFEDAFNEDEDSREQKPDVVDQQDTDEASGDAPKDQEPEDPTKQKEEVVEDPIKSGIDQNEPDTDTTDWKSKADELEAELKKERQRTSSWDGRIKAANQKVKDLEAEVKDLRAKLDDKHVKEQETEDMSDKEKMDMFREAFPELTDVVDILEKKINKIAPKETPAKVEPEPVTPDPEPTDENSDEPSDHYRQVTKAHPELDEMVRTGVLLTWINKQPDYISGHLADIYYGKNNQGSSKQVIDMISEFKTKSGWKSQTARKTKDKDNKLQAMLETDKANPGTPTDGPDKNDFAGTAKSIGL